MDNLLIPIPVLALLFACVAFFYASVGLGGGSSYTALLAIFGASTATIPMVSLTLNILVTTFGSIVFLLYGHSKIDLTMRYSKLSGVKAQNDYYQAMEKITGIEERDPIADVPPTSN